MLALLCTKTKLVTFAALLVSLAACSFNRDGYATRERDGGGGEADARIDAMGDDDGGPIDAAAIDAGETIDAAVPDADVPDAEVPDAAPPDAGVPGCPDGFVPLGDQGHGYRYVSSARRWTQAESDCEHAGPGTHLLVLDAASLADNEAERDAVLAILPTSNYFTRVWIGLSDRVTEGTYRAVTGATVAQEALPWLSNQPNNFGDEDCLEMTVNVSGSPSLSGHLNDARCGNEQRRAFVCECDGVEADPDAF